MAVNQRSTVAEKIDHFTVFDPETGCRIWCGGANVYGYGRTTTTRDRRTTTIFIHRFEWSRVFGRIPAGMLIDHTCRNRRCCRVEHLRLVTPHQNVIENSVSFVAANAAKTECPKCGGPYSVRPNGRRHCKSCQAASIAAWAAENKERVAESARRRRVANRDRDNARARASYHAAHDHVLERDRAARARRRARKLSTR